AETAATSASGSASDAEQHASAALISANNAAQSAQDAQDAVAGVPSIEMGTFTPEVYFGFQGQSNPETEMDLALGHYVKIGPMVTLWVTATFKVLSPGNNDFMLVQTAPIPVIPGFISSSAALLTGPLDDGGKHLPGMITSQGDGLYLVIWSNTGQPVVGGDFADNTESCQLIFTVSYLTPTSTDD